MATCFVKAPFRNAVTYALVRSRVAIRAELQESRSSERLSFCLRAIAPFPRPARDCSFSPQSVLVLTPPKILSAGIPHCAALRGPRQRGFFAHLIQMTASDYGRRERTSWSTTSSLSKTELRAAQPNLHSGRLRLLLQVAARPATSQARWKIKQTRARCASSRPPRPARGAQPVPASA